MPSIQLQINSLTHHDIAARREEFVRTAVGRRVVLVAVPFAGDPWCVAVYVGSLRIGNIVSGEARQAQRMLLAAPDEVVTGRIVEVCGGGYRLVADMGEPPMVSDEEVERARPLGLGAWTTSVAALAPTVAQTQRVAVLVKLMWTYAKIDAEAAVETAEALFEVMRYDLSGDMQRERKLLCQMLTESGDDRLIGAAQRLAEAAQRMGGDHQMAEVAEWLRTQLPLTPEANGVVEQTPRTVTRRQVLAEAEALPGGLYSLWQTDAVQFARVLYGMRLSSEELRRVLACLIWLERTTEAAEQEPSEESDRLQQFVAETKHYYQHNRKRADGICHILGNMGLKREEAELDAWIESGKKLTAVVVTEKVAEKEAPVPHFPPCRSYAQGVAALQFLKEKGFVPRDTDATNFLFRMGCVQEPPQQAVPVVWLKSKQLLRELLEAWFASAINDRSLKKAHMEATSEQVFCDADGEMVRLAKNKPVFSWESDALHDFLATI